MNENGVRDVAVLVGAAATDVEGLDCTPPNKFMDACSLAPKVRFGVELGTTELVKLPNSDGFSLPATGIALVLESVVSPLVAVLAAKVAKLVKVGATVEITCGLLVFLKREELELPAGEPLTEDEKALVDESSAANWTILGELPAAMESEAGFWTLAAMLEENVLRVVG